MKPKNSPKKDANWHNNSLGPGSPLVSVLSSMQNTPTTSATAPNPPNPSPQSNGSSPLPKTALAALIPSCVRERKYRACSFMSKLSKTQHSMLTAWLLNKDYSIEDIRQKVEAPVPKGFGLPVQRNTLRRLRARFDNANCNVAISDSLDLACDILEPEDAAETAPLLQSLIVMLYSRALFAMKMQAEPSAIDKLVTTIARLERLKSRSHRESRERSPLATRHHVELSVVSPASSGGRPQPAPEVIDLNATALPEAKKELERSDAGRQNTPNPVP